MLCPLSHPLHPINIPPPSICVFPSPITQISFSLITSTTRSNCLLSPPCIFAYSTLASSNPVLTPGPPSLLSKLPSSLWSPLFHSCHTFTLPLSQLTLSPTLKTKCVTPSSPKCSPSASQTLHMSLLFQKSSCSIIPHPLLAIIPPILKLLSLNITRYPSPLPSLALGNITDQYLFPPCPPLGPPPLCLSPTDSPPAPMSSSADSVSPESKLYSPLPLFVPLLGPPAPLPILLPPFPPPLSPARRTTLSPRHIPRPPSLKPSVSVSPPAAHPTPSMSLSPLVFTNRLPSSSDSWPPVLLSPSSPDTTTTDPSSSSSPCSISTSAALVPSAPIPPYLCLCPTPSPYQPLLCPHLFLSHSPHQPCSSHHYYLVPAPHVLHP